MIKFALIIVTILTLGSIESISYESEGPNLLQNENILDNGRSDYW